MSNPSG